MQASSELISAVSKLLWPLIIVYLIYTLRPVILALFETAKSRKFTLKVGGQELTMEEVDKQQRSLLFDLQQQVSELSNKLEGKTDLASRPSIDEISHINHSEQSHTRRSSILWVDDQPRNNSYLIQQLSEQNLDIDIALTTDQGMSMFARKDYKVVISDMGRQEGGGFYASAGLELLKKIRTENKAITFIFYTTSGSAAHYRNLALSLGANDIVSSPTKLIGLLENTIAH